MPSAAKQIEAYDEFRSQLAELREHNQSVVFDYEDPDGNKQARSHIYRLRQTKGAVDRVRKAEKQASLEYGRQVDAQAKAIVAEIDDMIHVHQVPLDEIEAREKQRQAEHERRIEHMRELAMESNEDITAAALRDRLKELETYRLGDHWQEFEIEASRVKEAGIESLRRQIERREKYEAEQAELARLRREQEERERQEREQRIAREAVEKAEREAQAREAEAKARAKAQQEAAERREQELKRQAEQAEARAERAEQEARERAAREAKEAADREAAEAKRREDNKRHRAKINNAAAKAFRDGGMDADTAKLAVTLVASKSVPNVVISY